MLNRRTTNTIDNGQVVIGGVRLDVNHWDHRMLSSTPLDHDPFLQNGFGCSIVVPLIVVFLNIRLHFVPLYNVEED